jgi:glucose/arabinose dehydrogenase
VPVPLRRSRRIVCARLGSAALLLVCLSACGGQPPQPPSSANGSERGEQRVTGTERLGWAQAAPSLQELIAYRYWVYVDGARAPLHARCIYGLSVRTRTCSAPLPPLSPGRHVLELTTTVTRDSQTVESARSQPLVLVVAGPADTNPEVTRSVRSTPTDGEYGYHPLAGGLRAPAAVAPLPDGTVLVGERGGTVKVVGASGPAATVALDAGGLRDLVGSEVVLHGVALHPEFHRNGFVYVLYSEAAAPDDRVTRVARFRYVGGSLGERAILLDGIPARPINPGGAIGFGADRKLYVATDDGGMAAEWRNDAASMAGKVLRLNDDGSADGDTAVASPAIFSGLHRPTAVGWDDARSGPWLVDEALQEPAVDRRAQNLAVHALRDVSSACVYRGTRFPRLDGKLLVAQGGALRAVDLGQPVTRGRRLALSFNVGRIQVVQADSRGLLYVATGNTGEHDEVGRDVLIRVAPQHAPH